MLSSPKRLQSRCLRLQKYSLKVHYKPGPQMYLSDTLSRGSLLSSQVSSEMPEYLIYQLTNEDYLLSKIADIAIDDNVFVTDQRLEQIQRETTADITLQTPMNAIYTGWPDDKMKTPPVLRPYWSYKTN